MKYKLSVIKKAAKENNFEMFKKVEYYRCYYCGKKLKSQTLFDELTKKDGYIVMDGGGICFCQNCGIDAIIPEHKDYDIDDDRFIQAMALYWFNGYAKYTDETMKIEGKGDYDNKFSDLIEINTVTIGPKRRLEITVKNSDVEKFKETFAPYVEYGKADCEDLENGITIFTYYDATNNGYLDEINALIKTGLYFSGTLGSGRIAMPEKFVAYDGHSVWADTNTDGELVIALNRDRCKRPKKDMDDIKYYLRTKGRIKRYFKSKDSEDDIEAIKPYQKDEKRFQGLPKFKGREVVLLE